MRFSYDLQARQVDLKSMLHLEELDLVRNGLIRLVLSPHTMTIVCGRDTLLMKIGVKVRF